MSQFFVYWIVSGNRHYIGATTFPKKRLRQHNGELKGGAIRTHNKGPWRFHAVISGFRTWKEALQFEWAFKFYSKKCRSVQSRMTQLNNTMERERWTSNSPLSSEVPLVVEYQPTQYGSPVFYTYSPLQQNLKCRSGHRYKRLFGVTY